MARIVHLNVGGTKFTTSISTLQMFPESMLAVMIEKENEKSLIQDGKELFVDRDGSIFGHILEYYRNGDNVILPEHGDILRKIMLEADYYQLTGLKELISAKYGAMLRFSLGDLVRLPESCFMTEMDWTSVTPTRILKPELLNNLEHDCKHLVGRKFLFDEYVDSFHDAEIKIFYGQIIGFNEGCVLVKGTFDPCARHSIKYGCIKDSDCVYHIPERFLEKA